MSFCSKCGTQFDGAFCPACGTPAAAQAQPFVQPQPVTYAYVKPKIPGRGFGISSMVLGIIGLFYGIVIFFSAIEYADSYHYSLFSGVDDSVAVMVLIYSVLSILGICFSAAAKNRGYRCGVSTSGMVTGVIGLVLYLISFFIFIGA